MAKLTTSKRASLPKKDFGLPGKGEGPKGTGSGSYPMPDREHASLAKGFAKRFASPAERAKIDAKANKVLGKKGGGGTSMAARDKADKAADRKAGIKQGSKADIARDKKAGVYKFEYGSKKPGGGGSKSPTGGKRAPSAPKSGSVRYGGGGMRRGY